MSAFLAAEWRHLVMFNYEMDPSLLGPLVPRGTELDTWKGTTYASIVAFRFLRTRILGIPVPLHRDFEEANLRFYVRCRSGAELRRGVVFIRELVPRRAVASLARWLYNEPYRALPMRSTVATSPELAVQYSWQLGTDWHTVSARTGQPLALPAAGSFEQFITEHYWGYTRQRDASTIEYHVTHPPWAVAPADSYRIDGDLTAVYGAALGARLATPVSVFLVNGSPVTVSRPASLGREQEES
ncbi:MAG TPA: DUF2071 domain-containing protein [Gemmatimonadales bacterium]|nr:DUF2071 domain-containing protein [Gemmatimonadales bacterium]